MLFKFLFYRGYQLQKNILLSAWTGDNNLKHSPFSNFSKDIERIFNDKFITDLKHKFKSNLYGTPNTDHNSSKLQVFFECTSGHQISTPVHVLYVLFPIISNFEKGR